MLFIIEIIQSLLLIISAILIIISAVGLVSLDKNLKNAVYARIHIIGVFDIACIIALIGLDQLLLAGIYFILAPFTAHAIANAFFKEEDTLNNPNIEDKKSDEEIKPSPFMHSKSELQKLEKEKDKKFTKKDEKFSISTLEIKEDE